MKQAQQTAQATQPSSTADGGLLQRACACGSHAAGGECEACRRRREGGLQRAAIRAAAPIQARLAVSQPGDIYEREADRIADEVMRMPDPQLQRQARAAEEEEDELVQTKPLAAAITPLLQRRAIGPEEEDEDEEPLQARSAETPQVTPALEGRIASLRGGGSPLPAGERAFFEPRFGADFSGVRVHTDARAAEMAQAVRAQAFTVGRDVVFGAGQYAPGTSVGRRMLGHELTHVVQQHGAVLPKTSGRQPGDEPYRVAQRTCADWRVAVQLSAPLGLARKKGPGETTMRKVRADDLVSEMSVSRKPPRVTIRMRSGDEFTYRWTELKLPEGRTEFTATLSAAGDLQVDAPGETVLYIAGSRDQPQLRSLPFPKSFKLTVVTSVGLEKSKAGPDKAQEPPNTESGTGGPILDPNAKEEGGKQSGLGALAGAAKTEQKLAQEAYIPVRADWDVLKDAALADHYLKILQHYGGRSISASDRDLAKKGLSAQDLDAIIAGKPLPRMLTALYTQGYHEFQQSGGKDKRVFFILEEVIAEQFVRGNPNATHNYLRIGYGIPEKNILGIVDRRNGILYYNTDGQPLAALGGVGMRDHGNISAKQQERFGFNIANIEDEGLRLFLNALRQTFSDPMRMTSEAAKAYFNNIEEVNKSVRIGLADEVIQKFEDALPMFIGFLAGHGLVTFLLRVPNPMVISVGLALKALLVSAGYIMSVDFGLGALNKLMQAARYLSRVEATADGSTTELSKDYIENAAQPLRGMVSDIALTFAMGRLAKLLRGGKRCRIDCTNCRLTPSGKAPSKAKVLLLKAFDPSRVIRYRISQAKGKPVPGNRQTGIDRAWRLEVELIRTTGQGTRPWTPSELSRILKGAGYRDLGYTGHHLNKVSEHPTWQGDPRNIEFLRVGKGQEHMSQGHPGGTRAKQAPKLLIDRQAMLDQAKSGQ